MDKRGYTDVVSPTGDHGSGAFKKKIKVEENYQNYENNGNSLNTNLMSDSLDPGYDINDLCFDDCEDELGLSNVSLFTLKNSIKSD